jgi:hypothetical protein
MLVIVNNRNLNMADTKIAKISVSFEPIPVPKLKCFDMVILKPKNKTFFKLKVLNYDLNFKFNKKSIEVFIKERKFW